MQSFFVFCKMYINFGIFSCFLFRSTIYFEIYNVGKICFYAKWFLGTFNVYINQLKLFLLLPIKLLYDRYIVFDHLATCGHLKISLLTIMQQWQDACWLSRLGLSSGTPWGVGPPYSHICNFRAGGATTRDSQPQFYSPKWFHQHTFLQWCVRLFIFPQHLELNLKCFHSDVCERSSPHHFTWLLPDF